MGLVLGNKELKDPPNSRSKPVIVPAQSPLLRVRGLQGVANTGTSITSHVFQDRGRGEAEGCRTFR